MNECARRPFWVAVRGFYWLSPVSSPPACPHCLGPAVLSLPGALR